MAPSSHPQAGLAGSYHSYGSIVMLACHLTTQGDRWIEKFIIECDSLKAQPLPHAERLSHPNLNHPDSRSLLLSPSTLSSAPSHHTLFLSFTVHCSSYPLPFHPLDL